MMTDQPPSAKGAAQVSNCLHLGLSAARPWTWSAEELGAVLNYELTSPLAFDLRGLPPGPAEQLRILCGAQGMLVNSLNSLIHHQHPPLEALKLAKDFAKVCTKQADGPIPQPVAQVIYYALIASALCRRRERISALTKDELERGFQWVLSLPWVTGEMRTLIEAAQLANQDSQ